jgi:hypothetical protein
MRFQPRFLIAAAALAVAASAASAGEGNVLYLIQEQDGVSGNTFFANQAAASYTSIGTVGDPARQRGEGHEADVTISVDCMTLTPCGTVALTQDNTPATLNAASPQIVVTGAKAGNTAVVTIAGIGNASITQIGDDNDATLQLGAGDGAITQTGLFNDALLEIAGEADGSIVQLGDSNAASLRVLGLQNSHVALTQTGTGLTHGTAATPIEVTTTQAGTVTINQIGNP